MEKLYINQKTKTYLHKCIVKSLLFINQPTVSIQINPQYKVKDSRLKEKYNYIQTFEKVNIMYHHNNKHSH